MGDRNGTSAAAGASPIADIAPYITPAPPVAPSPFMNDLRVTGNSRSCSPVRTTNGHPCSETKNSGKGSAANDSALTEWESAARFPLAGRRFDPGGQPHRNMAVLASG
ncbi:hypothetical protein GCM10009610_62810 [Pseudonocardia xinjiangensis]